MSLLSPLIDKQVPAQERTGETLNKLFILPIVHLPSIQSTIVTHDVHLLISLFACRTPLVFFPSIPSLIPPSLFHLILLFLPFSPTNPPTFLLSFALDLSSFWLLLFSLLTSCLSVPHFHSSVPLSLLLFALILLSLSHPYRSSSPAVSHLFHAPRYLPPRQSNSGSFQHSRCAGWMGGWVEEVEGGQRTGWLLGGERTTYTCLFQVRNVTEHSFFLNSIQAWTFKFWKAV